MIEPGGGTAIGALIGGGLGLAKGFFGDVGDPGGDNGLSQMNPDVRKRVGAMMAANPNLKVNSGYRTSMQQRRLYESGNPNAARPGKGPAHQGERR
jgi:hypothetical protein